MMYQYGNMKMHYEPSLDGGGREVYPEFLRLIRENIGVVKTVFDYCAGTGFIGFSLLEDRICERLVMSDISPAAIECCKETVKENGLEGRVDLYVSDCLKQVPLQNFDLVVANPPHFAVRQTNLPQNTIINVDTDWSIHRGFYHHIGKYLNPKSSTLFVENGRGSHPELFREMILDGGLDIAGVFPCNLNRPSKFYFIWAKNDKSL